MPKLSDTMEEGTIVEWKKKTGDQVKTGEVLAEVESDKATFDLEAEADGVLSILVDKGVPAKIGAPIARIGDTAEAPAPKPSAPPKPATEAKQKQPNAQPQVAEEQQPVAESAPAAEPPAPRPKAAAQEPQDGQTDGDEVRASPLARRLAGEMGVDLAALKGSGPEGRIVKEDVLAAATSKPKAERRRPQPAAPRAGGPDVELIEPTRMQATIARRMAEAKSTVPEFQTSWADGRFQRKRTINIGLAVAPSQGMGLLVPVVHDADLKDLVQISIESRQVIERARSGRPNEGDLSGATFSISNLGMYGVDEFVAIINPPEAAILAVGAIKDVPVVEGGRIVPGKVMRMTLSVDHRVFYGATAAQFMAEVRRLIENPVTLVVSQA